MHVMLLLSPNGTPTLPHPALPKRIAFLRGHGLQVTQHDLNIEMFETVQTRCNIERMLDRLRREYGSHAERRSLRRIAPPRDLVVQALHSGPVSAARIDRAKKALRCPAFFDGLSAQEALTTVVEALQIASLPFFRRRSRLGRIVRRERLIACALF
ncbi:hypothetical protein [Roseiflexus sp.]|uniref:hypothetical protein n=1 Tax=Roseiflexus sp. TaxID=2562120 RepID=UPI00398B462C